MYGIKLTQKFYYIGQTGNPLYSRLSQLKVIQRDVMPYNDPHTAGPARWALLQQTGRQYEASVCPLDGISAALRKGFECLAIAHYRLEFNRSPRFNFGRMPLGYSKSSGNNAALAARGKRFRGIPTDEQLACHQVGVKPAGPLDVDFQAADWCGHTWSPWTSLKNVPSRSASNGLYRLRASEGPTSDLIYIGQGKVFSRLRQHAKTAMTDSLQGLAFAAGQPLQTSWVLNDDWAASQLLELENDLIAAHVLHSGKPPAGQFIG